MKILALSGIAFGSLALGALAAGWLVALTPLPIRLTAPAETRARARLASTIEADAVATLSTRPALAASTLNGASSTPDVATVAAPPPQPPKASAAARTPKKVLAAPILATRPSAPIIVAVKHRLAKAAALVLPPHSAPKAVPQVDHRYDNVLTASQISRIKASLRLSSEQEPYWPRVAEMLQAVGRRQMAAAASGAAPNFGSSGDLMQFYFAAQPLLRSLRDDQKAEVRRLAHRMGFGSVESYI